MARISAAAFVLMLTLAGACGGGGSESSSPAVDVDAGATDASDGAVTPAADWVLSLDPGAEGAKLDPALLGQYDLSGALFHYDQVAGLATTMKAAGFGEWRVGLGRWEFATELFPTLTDGTACPGTGLPANALAPAGTSDLDLLAKRDWFTYTDGAPVTATMTADDSRYALAYVRSVLDVAAGYGAAPYADIDLMPRALAKNTTPTRTAAYPKDACTSSFTNGVSNSPPADGQVFAAAVAGLVQRVVEGSGGEKARSIVLVEL